MRFDRRLGGLLGLLLLAACGDGGNSKRLIQPLNQTASRVEPKIVLQIAHQAPVVAVRWVNGGKNMVSLAEDGSIVVWDVDTRAILDVAQVPANWSLDSGSMLTLAEITPGANGKSLELIYRNAINYQETAEGFTQTGDACPEGARRAGDWCTFLLDLDSRKVTPDSRIVTPAAYVENDPGEQARMFPLSPDGKWRPMPNHDDGKPGLFNQSDDHLQFPDSTCTSIARCRYGVNLVALDPAAGTKVYAGEARAYFLDIDISEDGQRLLWLEGLVNDTKARAYALDLTNGSKGTPYETDRAYHHVSWLGDRRFILTSEGYFPSNDMPDAAAGFPSALIVDPCATGGECRKDEAVPSYYSMQPLDDGGSFFGIGSLDGCFRMYPDILCLQDPSSPQMAGGETHHPFIPGVSVFRAKPASGPPEWALARQPALPGQVITAIRLSPDKRQLAVATREWKEIRTPQDQQILRVLLFEVDDGALSERPRELARIVNPVSELAAMFMEDTPEGEMIAASIPQLISTRQLLFYDSATIERLDFTGDGEKVIFSQTVQGGSKRAALYIADTTGAAPLRKVAGRSRQVIAAGNARIVGLDNRELIDAADGSVVARLPGEAQLKRAGFIAASNLIWTANEDGQVELWDAGNGAKQLTLYLGQNNSFFAVAPGGRYDTNLGPDSGALRWLVPDAPWQSLGPQTFMRDFYEPELYRKLLDCRAADNCAAVFKQLPSIESLNRVTPQVTISGVRQGKDAAEAIVTVEVSEGFDKSAANGKTRSGIYNPRLFRNGRVVAMTPDEPDAVTDTPEKWRKLNVVTHAANEPATHSVEFHVPLPTAPGTEQQEFSAYAFNEDRIKSETATFTYQRPPIVPRKPKAYVITIGIDDYDTERLRLHYAVADARLIAERLHDIPGYEMRRLTLAGERLPDGTRVPVNNITIMRVLSLVMTGSGRAEVLARLNEEDRVYAEMLEQATPDDIVIVSFSGHGWADPQGNFYLIPSNGTFLEDTGKPELRNLLATAQLTRYFRAIDAAEITLIIDACHSSASVASAGFKPGPMGDSGLGQLAYDKGIRILAATQADDVAMEDAKLGQGLLSYALAAEGLTATGGKADLDGDRAIRLDEWLNYGVARLPELSSDVRLAQLRPGASGARAIEFHDLAPTAAKRRVQKPSLFDFNAAPSRVVLRDRVR